MRFSKLQGVYNAIFHFCLLLKFSTIFLTSLVCGYSYIMFVIVRDFQIATMYEHLFIHCSTFVLKFVNNANYFFYQKMCFFSFPWHLNGFLPTSVKHSKYRWLPVKNYFQEVFRYLGLKLNDVNTFITTLEFRTNKALRVKIDMTQNFGQFMNENSK